mgnify:CR=1 FL=1
MDALIAENSIIENVLLEVNATVKRENDFFYILNCL